MIRAVTRPLFKQIFRKGPTGESWWRYHSIKKTKSGRSSIRILYQAFDDQFSRWSRLFWVIIFGICIYFCCANLVHVAEEFQAGTLLTKTIINNENAVPFPAVTLCNLNPYLRSRVNQLRGVAEVIEGYNVANQALTETLEENLKEKEKRSLDDVHAVDASHNRSKRSSEPCTFIQFNKECYDVEDPNCIASGAYNGNRATTISGRTCQGWSVNSPHIAFGSYSNFPENYCQVTEGREGGPWCHTTDPKLRWENCFPDCNPTDCVSIQNDAACYNVNTSGCVEPWGYYGDRNETRHGQNCQRWNDSISINETFLPLLTDNYCRNPNGADEGPWCYTSTGWDYCFPVCEPVKCVFIELNAECYDTKQPECRKGSAYTGTASKTVSGRTCQAWSSNTPQQPHFALTLLPENYCRNYDNEDAPWCYTMDVNVRWELCFVPCVWPTSTTASSTKSAPTTTTTKKTTSTAVVTSTTTTTTTGTTTTKKATTTTMVAVTTTTSPTGDVGTTAMTDTTPSSAKSTTTAATSENTISTTAETTEETTTTAMAAVTTVYGNQGITTTISMGPGTTTMIANDGCAEIKCPHGTHCVDYKVGYTCLNSTMTSLIAKYLIKAEEPGDTDEPEQPSSLSMSSMAHEMLLLASGRETLEARISAGYQMDELFSDCKFNNEGDCKSLFNKQTNHMSHGNCYTFNDRSDELRQFTHRPGLDHGMSLLLTVGSDEYLDTELSVGFKMILHSPGVDIFPDSEGYLLAPQYHNAFALSFGQYKKIKDCAGSTQDPGDYFYPGNYTVTGCERSRLQRKFIKECHCLNPEYPGPSGIPNCGILDYNCVFTAASQSYEKENVMSPCLEPCWQEEYKATATVTRYILNDYMMKANNNSGGPILAKKDMLKVHIFYPHLGYAEYVEVMQRDVQTLLSDIGSLFGLLLGASYITFIELIVFLLEWTYTVQIKNEAMTPKF